MEERWGRRRGSQLSGSVALVVRTDIAEGERGLERAEDEGSRSPKEMTSSDARVAQVEERETFDARGLSPLPMPEALPDLPPSIGQILRMTSEPVRPMSIALSTLPRHNSQPPPFQLPDPLPTPPPPSTQRTTRQKFLAPFRMLLNLRTTTKPRTRRKRNTEKLATRFVVVSLLLFCITAITCISPTRDVLTIDIALAFSLPNFPNFLHIVFIGILFIQFTCVIKALLYRTRIARKKLLKETSSQQALDGPPAGAIIQGAPNWAGLDDEADEEEAGGFDLESVGVEEALKPVPPAYGMYRGSVRIRDHDIRYVVWGGE